MLNLINSLILPIALGYFAVSLILRGCGNLLFKLALSIGCGMSILTHWMLILSILKVPISYINVALPLALLTIVLGMIVIKLKIKNEKIDDRLYKISNFDRYMIYIFLFFVVYNIYAIFWKANSVPIIGWDVFSSIGLKSKAIFYDQSLNNLSNMPHSAYPLHVYFMIDWTALNLGYWSDQALKFIFPIYLLSFIYIFHHVLRIFASKLAAIGGLVLLLSSNLFVYHATVAYLDFPLLYYYCTATMLLMLWSKSWDNKYLLLSSLFAGFGTFVKVEGLLHLVVLYLVVLFLLFQKKEMSLVSRFKNFFIFAIPSIFIYCLFYSYRIIVGITSDHKTQFLFDVDFLERVINIIVIFTFEFFGTGNWNLCWLLFFISLCLYRSIRKSLAIDISVLSVLVNLLLLICVALFTHSYKWIAGEFPSVTFSRIVLHFFPLAVLSITLICSQVTSENTVKS